MTTMADLKAEGNRRFAAGDWQAAAMAYSQAMQIAPTGSLQEKKDAMALFSNRAACYTSVHQYDYALLDIAKVQQLMPDWSKGHVREGEVYAHLQDFKLSSKAYLNACRLAEDDATRARYQQKYQAVSRKLQSQSMTDAATSTAGGAVHSAQTAEDHWSTMHAANPNFELKPGSSLEMAFKGLEKCKAIMATIDDGVSRHPDGIVVSNIGDAVQRLATMLLADPRGFIVPSGKDSSFWLMAKLQWLLKHHTEAKEWKPFTSGAKGQTLQHQKIIDSIDAQRQRNGFGNDQKGARQDITGLISAVIVTGFLECEMPTERDSAATGLQRFESVLALIDAGRERWSAIPDKERGFSFSNNFRRSVIGRIITCETQKVMILQISRASEQAVDAQLQKLERISNSLLQDCRTNPLKRDSCPSEDYHVYQEKSLTSALQGLAQVYSTRSRFSSKIRKAGIATLHDVALSKKAAECFKEIAELMPDDAADLGTILYHCLYYDLRGGGLTVARVFDDAAKAEEAFAAGEKAFGFVPESRNFESRVFCRTQCQGLRDWILAPGNEAESLETTTVKPVPTVNFRGATAAQKRTPVSEAFWRSLEGQVGLADVRGMQG